jgi:dehydrogenase/reductase SDR family member 7B
MPFIGEVVWITGASSGIGAALARAFGAAGACVILSGRKVSALEAVARELPEGKSLILPFEATAFDALPGIVERAQGWQGRIDILVNNAGVSQRSQALETDMAVYRQLMEVDFFAPVRLTQLVLPMMVQARKGQLVAIASVAGKFGAPLRTGYSAAKHAIVGYFDALRAEVSRYGIKVAIVTPGFVATDIARNALMGDGSRNPANDDPVDSGMSPDMAARIILAGLENDKEEIAMGGRTEMMGLWLKRFFPKQLSKRLQAMGAALPEVKS